MIDLNTLEEGVSYSPSDFSSPATQQLRRLLYSTARRHNQTWRESENLKDASDFYKKPFQFIHLPREVRDQIYIYVLRAPSTSSTIERAVTMLSVERYPFKPPTPGFLRSNKQIYQEAIEILYSKNRFKFETPGALIEFEERIGATNRQLVRSVCIYVTFPPWSEEAQAVVDPSPPPEDLPLSEYECWPSHWIQALRRSCLEKITHFEVEGEELFSSVTYLVSMPVDLQQSIQEVLSRNQDGSCVPNLTLKGFREEEGEKFPSDWEIVIDQWEDYKKEMRGLEEEMREGLENLHTQWNFDLGSSSDGSVETSDDE